MINYATDCETIWAPSAVMLQMSGVMEYHCESGQLVVIIILLMICWVHLSDIACSATLERKKYHVHPLICFINLYCVGIISHMISFNRCNCLH